ncbi:histidine kinase [Lentzea sp. NPDC003310]|uniref:sensor histidine kinase n=1 Tax=Lentzea sp. NPDC003310 TaxID=3154447 RepID=UPI0033B67900
MVTRALSRVMPIVAWLTLTAVCVWLVVSLAGVGGELHQYFAGEAVTVLSFTTVGALVVSRQPSNVAGMLLLAPVLIAAEGVLIQVAELADRHQLSGAVWVWWLARWIWVAGVVPPMTLLPLVLPDGHLPHQRWRPLAVLTCVLNGLLLTVIAFVPMPAYGPPSPVEIELLAWQEEYNAAIWVVLGVCALAALASQVHRLLLARGRARSQVLWIALGAWTFVLGKLLVEYGLGDPLDAIVGFGSTLALPVACGVAILRHDLLRLDRLLRQLLLYAVLTTLLAACYLALREVAGADLVVATGTAVGLALVTPPLHRWLGGRVTRLLYGKRGSPAEVLADLSRHLSAVAGPDAVLAALADAVVRTLPVSTVHVVLTSGQNELRRVTRGAHDPVSGSVPLRFQGIELGRIDIAPAAPGLATADEALLADLAGTAAAAVAAAHRSEELQRAREQLVITREKERHRIARDLHDELGPVLSGLGFTLDALRASVKGTGHAEAVTTQARTDVREAVQLVRRVARELRPPLLDHLGLVGAVRELAARHTGPSLSISVGAGDLGDLTAATEVAAHAIVAEALTNTARHSAGRHCTITLQREGDLLQIKVEDDGVGLDGAAGGLGRTSMVERAEELGGWCRAFTRESGGTTVEACLPAITVTTP